MSKPVTIAILDSGRTDERLYALFINNNSYRKYVFIKSDGKWLRKSFIYAKDIKNQKTIKKVNGNNYLTKVYASTDYFDLIGKMLVMPDALPLSTIIEEGSGYYSTDTRLVNIKSGKIIGEGEYQYDDNNLDITWSCWLFYIFKENCPNDPPWDFSWGNSEDKNVTSTKYEYTWWEGDELHSQWIWPDYFAVNCHVDVNAIYPSAHISGPIQFPKGKTARFYVTVNGGFEPYNYQWWVKEVTTNPYRNIIDEKAGIRRPPTDVWVQASGDEICDHACYLDFYIKCVVTDKNGNSDTSNILFVDVTDDDVWPPRP